MLANSINSTLYGKNNTSFYPFFEYSADGMLVIAQNGNIVNANSSVCHLFQTSCEELCAAKYAEITAIDSVSLAQLTKEIADCGRANTKIQFKRSEKDFFQSDVNVFLLDDKGRSKPLLGFILKETSEVEAPNIDPVQFYQEIVQLAKEGIWVYDENHITIFASEALCKMLGYACEEMVGRDLLCFIDESRRVEAKEHLKRRKDGLTEQFDFALLAKNGQLIWTIINASPIFKDDVYQGAIAVITDITARKKVEDEIVSREDRFRVMVENSYDIILLLDANLRTVYRSPSNTSILGFTDDERLGRSYLEIAHPDDVDKLIDLQQVVFDHPGQSIPITIRARHKDGRYLWFMGVATNLLHEKNVQGVVINLRDISERKKTEDDLKRLSNRLQLATQAANVCIADWDIAGNYVTFDDCMFKLYQIEREKFDHKFDAWAQCVHPHDQARITQEIELALISKNDFKLKFKIMLPDGDTKHIISMCIIERDVTGQAVRIVATNRDVTKQVVAAEERDKLIAELIERNKALEQFAYIVSHNLRAPVANLTSLAAMITEGDLDETDRNQVISGLSTSVIKIDQIITDLNGIFQSKQHLYDHKETVDLPTLINDIQFSISDLMVREKVILKRDFSKGCNIYTTRLYLYSILYNIILNAIKYRKPEVPPVIDVIGTRQDGWLNIAVTDNGRGIDLQRNGDKLFGLYKRFDHTVEGRGIGLYMVKTQIEALGGHVKVESQLGKGSLFMIAIPISE